MRFTALGSLFIHQPPYRGESLLSYLNQHSEFREQHGWLGTKIKRKKNKTNQHKLLQFVHPSVPFALTIAWQKWKGKRWNAFSPKSWQNSFHVVLLWQSEGFLCLVGPHTWDLIHGDWMAGGKGTSVGMKGKPFLIIASLRRHSDGVIVSSLVERAIYFSRLCAKRWSLSLPSAMFDENPLKALKTLESQHPSDSFKSAKSCIRSNSLSKLWNSLAAPRQPPVPTLFTWKSHLMEWKNLLTTQNLAATLSCDS